MAQNQYAVPHQMRKKSGEAKTAPSGDATMRIEGVNDPTDEKFPLIPKKEGPQLPIDDKYRAFRSQQA